MTYTEAYEFAQTYCLVYLMLLFLGVQVYALWPGNRRRFDDAAKIPLRED